MTHKEIVKSRENAQSPSEQAPAQVEEVIEVIEEEIIEEVAEPREMQDRVIYINRVAKVVKGGRRFTFTALVTVGDGQGRVGLGYGKARDVLSAIKKGQEKAKKDMIDVPIIKGTIPHSVKQKYSAAVVFLKPASPGTGIIAGGPVRSILEMAGVRNVLAKSLGRTSTRINVARATFEALRSLMPLDEVQARRRSSLEY